MTTCTSGLVSWGYSGKAANLSLSIDNIGVPQDDDVLFRIKARQSTVNAAIQQQLVDTNTSVLSWTWPSVNLTQGWYEIQGLVLSSPTVSNKSAPFFISNGSDTTCLISTASSSASASAASDINVAGIVGGVVGGVVGVTLAFIAGVCLWSRRRKRSFGGGRRDGKWGSLKSTSSSTPPEDGGVQPTSNNFHAHSESMGAILHDVGGGKMSATSTPGGSDEDVIVVSEEKLVSPASSSGMSPFDALNTPLHHDRRISMYSIQTPAAAAVSENLRSHAPSAFTSTQGLELQAHRIRSSMETSFRRRSERLSMPTLPSPALSRSTTRTQEEYPLAPVSPTPVNRSISAGAVSMAARRTARKPVPQYDSILLEGKNADSASSFTGGAGSSQSHGTGLGTGAYGTPSGLVHKASFGDGRPVHYLIPDMPPPQRD